MSFSENKELLEVLVRLVMIILICDRNCFVHKFRVKVKNLISLTVGRHTTDTT